MVIKMKMTSRQRIIETLNHREPDGLAIDFGGMRSTGISAIAYNKLKAYLGMAGGVTKVYDVFQQLAEPEQEIMERMGADVVQLHRYAPSFGIANDKWKEGLLPDGSPCLYPKQFNPQENERGEKEIRDGELVLAKMPAGGLYYDSVHFPYQHVESRAEIDEIPIGGMDEAELSYLRTEAARLYAGSDKAIIGAFGGNILEAGLSGWGFEKFFCEMAAEPELVHYWLEKLTDQYMDDLKRYLAAVGTYINVIQFGDDLGTQKAPVISPQMYREMIKPYHQRQYRYVREHYPAVKVFLHSCGAIRELIPDLIDAGVDILNPVQISAQGMDPFELKRDFGKDIVFWGGGADMQQSVKASSIGQIKSEVRRLIETFSPGGGFVFSQVHNILADVPPEKIMAIYDTALEYR